MGVRHPVMQAECAAGLLALHHWGPRLCRRKALVLLDNEPVRAGLSPGAVNRDNMAGRGGGVPFTSLYDFCRRVVRTRLNKRTVEALVKAGAFDAIERNRAALVASIDRAFEFAQACEANAHQGGLFDEGDDHGSSTQEPDLVRVLPWGVKERLTLEKTAVGFYLSVHLFAEV